MAFKLHSTDDGHVPAWENFPVSSLKPEVGMGLALDEATGLMKASALPTHICMRTEGAAVAEGTMIPCVKIHPNQIWESRLYSAAPDAKIGIKADLSSTGLYVNGKSATNANFLITYLSDTVINSVVRGRFVK